MASSLAAPPMPRAEQDQLTARLLTPLWTRSRGRGWWLLFGLTALGTLWLGVTVTYTVTTGIGVWGNNIPVAWAYGIKIGRASCRERVCLYV